MGNKGCYLSVSTVVNQASEGYGKAFVLDELKNRRLWSACAIIDKMAEEDECSFSLAIADEAHRMTLVLECDYELILQDGRNHPFFSLVKKMDSFSFSKAGDDKIQINLILNGLWVQKS